jgi:hypothetical protein
MPNDDLYSSGEEDSPEDKSPKDDSAEDMDEQKTALLPKSIFKGKDCKPGDVVEMKVEHLFDEEVEVSYTGKYNHKDGESESEDMEESERELDNMAE